VSNPTSVPHPPLIDFLRDPNAWWHQAWTKVAATAERWWLPSVLAVVGLVACIVGIRGELLRRRSLVMNRGARLITVLVPPTVDPSAGQAFWAHLHGLLRPAWRRAASGQPHLEPRRDVLQQ